MLKVFGFDSSILWQGYLLKQFVGLILYCTQVNYKPALLLVVRHCRVAVLRLGGMDTYNQYDNAGRLCTCGPGLFGQWKHWHRVT